MYVGEVIEVSVVKTDVPVVSVIVCEVPEVDELTSVEEPVEKDEVPVSLVCDDIVEELVKPLELSEVE